MDIVRLDKEDYKVIKKMCGTSGLKMSELMRVILRVALKNSKELRAMIDEECAEHLREKEYRKKQKELREKKAYYYQLRNFMNFIYKFQMSAVFNSGEFNGQVTSDVLKTTLELFELMPVDIQKNLKEEIVNLDKYRNVESLNQFMGKMAKLQMLEGRK